MGRKDEAVAKVWFGVVLGFIGGTYFGTYNAISEGATIKKFDRPGKPAVYRLYNPRKGDGIFVESSREYITLEKYLNENFSDNKILKDSARVSIEKLVDWDDLSSE